MKVPAFIKRIGAGLSSALAPVQAFVGRHVEKFEEFKDRNPRFTRMWNVLTHPTTTRILGIVVAVAIAPLTGGFTLPLAVSLSLSVAALFSTTMFMGIQRWRLAKAEARLKVVKDIVAARSTIAALTQKPGLTEKVEDLKKKHSELGLLLDPKPTEIPEKQSRLVTLKLAESLYYEGAVCLAVMIACFGTGGAIGFMSSVATGLSGFVGQTRNRLRVTQSLYDIQGERNYESAKEGLGSLSPAEEREIRMQGIALSDALDTVEKNPEFSLDDVYATRLLELRRSSSDSPATPGVIGCIIAQLNPFRVESKQEPAAASHAPAKQAEKEAPRAGVKPGPTPHVETTKSKKAARPRHE